MALPHAVADGVKECLKKANSGSLAGALGDLLQLLLKEGYAYTQRTNSVHIGCHPSNRDGAGISTSHVQSLASQFFELGFDPSLQRPIAVELQSDDVAIQTWNQELVGLAPVSKPLKFASLSASHTNQVLRSFIHQMPHDDDRLTFNGKMSSQKLKSQDTLYFAAVEEGLKDESHEMMYIYISTVFFETISFLCLNMRPLLFFEDKIEKLAFLSIYTRSLIAFQVNFPLQQAWFGR